MDKDDLPRKKYLNFLTTTTKNLIIEIEGILHKD